MDMASLRSTVEATDRKLRSLLSWTYTGPVQQHCILPPSYQQSRYRYQPRLLDFPDMACWWRIFVGKPSDDPATAGRFRQIAETHLNFIPRSIPARLTVVSPQSVLLNILGDQERLEGSPGLSVPCQQSFHLFLSRRRSEWPTRTKPSALTMTTMTLNKQSRALKSRPRKLANSMVMRMLQKSPPMAS